MKNRDLMQLALMGLAAAGLVAGQPLMAAEGKPVAQSYSQNPNYSQSTTTTTTQTTKSANMTASQQKFYNMLNDQGKQQFMAMDSKGRDTAIQVFNAPAGQNVCAGLNACAQPGVHDCAGLGSCKNTSTQAFTDPNEAVQVTYNKMMANRQGMSQ
jgi:hypothetical protein